MEENSEDIMDCQICSMVSLSFNAKCVCFREDKFSEDCDKLIILYVIF